MPLPKNRYLYIILSYKLNAVIYEDTYACKLLCEITISPNEVFGDKCIMVLASPPRPGPRPPVDPDDVNLHPVTRKIFNLSLSNIIYG